MKAVRTNKKSIILKNMILMMTAKNLDAMMFEKLTGNILAIRLMVMNFKFVKFL